MAGTAAAASAVFTVILTSSEPASASALTCATVAGTFAVSVLVIDWTTIGAPPPIATPPTSTCRAGRRVMVIGSLDEIARSAMRVPASVVGIACPGTGFPLRTRISGPSGSGVDFTIAHRRARLGNDPAVVDREHHLVAVPDAARLADDEVQRLVTCGVGGRFDPEVTALVDDGGHTHRYPGCARVNDAQRAFAHARA